jgi:3-dehydrotetronate 4-kinase
MAPDTLIPPAQPSLLGCIADDFTGATDLANNLVQRGLSAVQTIGVPASGVALSADAVVVALKTRTCAPYLAVQQSQAALRYLKNQGAERIYFKVCSTFDSTDKGNIGIVIDALMDELEADFSIVCPAFPAAGRTVYQGHLFVGTSLLSDSPMRHHPLTPMLDANLVRVLQRQTARTVGLVGLGVVAQGADAVRAEFSRLQAAGVQIAVVDAVSDADLRTLGAAVVAAQLPLVTAGSGLALGLVQQGANSSRPTLPTLPTAPGGAVVLAGSCSGATLGQVLHWSQTGRALRLDPLQMAAGQNGVAEALAFATQPGTALIYSSASPDEVAAVQAKIGTAAAGHMVEDAMAALAAQLYAQGTRRFVVAGGETSGAVVHALGITRLNIGPQIATGVPWCEGVRADGATLAIALKSGNFGEVDFFSKALAMLG